MRPGNNNRRGRGRGQRKPHGGGAPHSHGGMPVKSGQTFDSSGPDIRVRGNAYQVLEKYLQLARDAGTAGDRIAAENFLQHADHYYRVVASMNEGQRPRIGGREVSVADMNVQNVSQGLSAAMSGHGHSGGGADDQADSGPQPGNSAPRQDRSHGQQSQDQQSQDQQSQDQHSESQHSDGQNSDGQHSGGRDSGRERSARQNSTGERSGERPDSRQHPAVANSGDSDANGGGRNGSVGESADNSDRGQRKASADEQPDYPEELLPKSGQRGPSESPSDGRQSDGRQSGGQQSDGQAAAGPNEGRQQARGRGRRRGPASRVRGESEETSPPIVPSPIPPESGQ